MNVEEHLHAWEVVAEHDAGYVVGRCRTCGAEDLLDLDPPAQV